MRRRRLVGCGRAFAIGVTCVHTMTERHGWRRVAAASGWPRVLALVLVSSLALSACESVPAVDYARPYPRELPPGPVLDVQVFRRAKTLEFTNTTGAALGPGTLWLNRRFSRPIKEPIGVGQSVSIPLIEFRDEFGDAFKPGGFWATENPDAVALCQLEVPREGQKAEIIGLVTVQSVAED